MKYIEFSLSCFQQFVAVVRMLVAIHVWEIANGLT